MTSDKPVQNISMLLEKQLNKYQSKTCPPHVTASCTDMSLLFKTQYSCEKQEKSQGLLGERDVNTPEASSMVFLRAVSLATLWLRRLSRSWGQNI